MNSCSKCTSMSSYWLRDLCQISVGNIHPCFLCSYIMFVFNNTYIISVNHYVDEYLDGLQFWYLQRCYHELSFSCILIKYEHISFQHLPRREIPGPHVCIWSISVDTAKQFSILINQIYSLKSSVGKFQFLQILNNAYHWLFVFLLAILITAYWCLSFI